MPEMVEVLVNNKWPLILPDFRAERIEWSTGWEVERLDAMHEVIKPGDVVYDVGSEEGDISALLQQWSTADHFSHPHGVVLIEPNPQVWPHLRAIWEANNLRYPLAMFQGFLTGDRQEPTGIPVTDWPACSNGDMIRAHGFLTLEQGWPDVPRLRLDDLLDYCPPPDVITMDVEGAEYEVIRGAQKTLLEHRPHVFVSIHAEFMLAAFREAPGKIHQTMKDWGYEVKFLGMDHEEHFHYIPR